MNKKNNKKAITYMTIISTIVVIISLITFIFYINNFITNSKYESSKLQCSEVFKKIESNSNIFFTGSNSKLELEKILINNCNSYQYLIEDEKLNNAAKAILDCYQKTNKLNNIFPSSQTRTRTICMQCGIIKTDNIIENFNEKLIKKLKNEKVKLIKSESSAKNLNELFLFNEKFLPKTLNENENIIVTYFIANLDKKYEVKSDTELDTNFGTSNQNEVEVKVEYNPFWKKTNELTNEIVNFISNSNNNVVTGISLYKFKKDNQEFNQKEKVKIYNKESIINCNEFYIPNKNDQIN